MEENAKLCNVKKENMEQYGIVIHAHRTPDESRSYPLSGKSYNGFGFLHLVPLSPEESFWRRFGAADDRARARPPAVLPALAAVLTPWDARRRGAALAGLRVCLSLRSAARAASGIDTSLGVTERAVSFAPCWASFDSRSTLSSADASMSRHTMSAVDRLSVSRLQSIEAHTDVVVGLRSSPPFDKRPALLYEVIAHTLEEEVRAQLDLWLGCAPSALRRLRARCALLTRRVMVRHRPRCRVVRHPCSALRSRALPAEVGGLLRWPWWPR